MDMTKIQDLPPEILQNIFQSAIKPHLCEYARVCKTWKNSVESVLYDIIMITTHYQFKKFCESVMHDPRLGEHVKTLCLRGYSEISQKEELCKLFVNVLYVALPNLQELDITLLRTYAPVLSALQKSQLIRLKVLHSPYLDLNYEQKELYTLCILLMYERAEKIKLYLDGATPTDFTSTKLYNNLDKFIVLKKLRIDGIRGASLIPAMEHVTASCKTLNHIEFSSESENGEGIDVDTSAIIPSENIRSLRALSNDKRIIQYIMHKFPQLQHLAINDCKCIQEFTEYLRLLEYLSRMRTFEVEMLTPNKDRYRFTARHWNMLSASLGSKIVEERYCKYEDGNKIVISKSKNATEPTHSFLYRSLQENDGHNRMMDMMGEYVGEFHLIFNVLFEQRLGDVTRQYLEQLFKHCPRLHTLHFQGWILRESCLPLTELSIRELYFKTCNIFGTFLNHLSSVLPLLNRLIFEGVSYFAGDGEIHAYSENNRTKLEINMPRTKLNTITFIKSRCRTSYYTKLFVVSEGAYFYYRYDEGYFTSSEEEFNRTKENCRIYIRCMNKPKIEFICKSSDEYLF